jgi:hypothetical protein
MFHLRPFNSQHCQVPVTNGRGALTPEFRDYLAFVEDLFALLAAPAPARRRALGLPRAGHEPRLPCEHQSPGLARCDPLPPRTARRLATAV